MSFRTLSAAVLLVLHFVASIATPVTTAADELVKVPGGFLPRSNVHIVPTGAKIVHTPDLVQLFDSAGMLLHSASLTGSQPLLSNLRAARNASLVARQSTSSGTVVATASAPQVSSFLGQWLVPPLPQKNSGQLLQYFTGVGTSDLSSLIFPVLQYGVAANGGFVSSWSLATWLITGNQAFATNATAAPISPNARTEAVVSNEDNILLPPAGTDVWLGSFSPGGPQTALQVQSTVQLTEVVVALETTNAFLTTNLPNEPTDLNLIAVLNNGGSAPATIPWQVSPPVDFDFITMEVLSNSGNSGSIAILYDEQA